MSAGGRLGLDWIGTTIGTPASAPRPVAGPSPGLALEADVRGAEPRPGAVPALPRRCPPPGISSTPSTCARSGSTSTGSKRAPSGLSTDDRRRRLRAAALAAAEDPPHPRRRRPQRTPGRARRNRPAGSRHAGGLQHGRRAGTSTTAQLSRTQRRERPLALGLRREESAPPASACERTCPMRRPSDLVLALDGVQVAWAEPRRRALSTWAPVSVLGACAFTSRPTMPVSSSAVRSSAPSERWRTRGGRPRPRRVRRARRLPTFCINAARAVAADQGAGVEALGVVFGGSGNGEQIAANKVDGSRAALVWNLDTASLLGSTTTPTSSRSGLASTRSTRRSGSSTSSSPRRSRARAPRARIAQLAEYEATGAIAGHEIVDARSLTARRRMRCTIYACPKATPSTGSLASSSAASAARRAR